MRAGLWANSAKSAQQLRRRFNVGDMTHGFEAVKQAVPESLDEHESPGWEGATDVEVHEMEVGTMQLEPDMVKDTHRELERPSETTWICGVRDKRGATSAATI